MEDLFSATEVGRAGLGHLACAGAVGVGAGRVVLGYYGGFGVYGYPDLELQYERWDLVPEDCAISGVHVREDGLFLLGQHRGQCHEPSLRDWWHRLHALRWDDFGEVGSVPLGPGNWQAVGGGQGDLLVVYDRTEGQGVRAYRLPELELAWTHESGNFERVDLVDGDRLVLRSRSGAGSPGAWSVAGLVDGERDDLVLPDPGDVAWTAVRPTAETVLLGGTSSDNDKIVLAMSDASGRLLTRLDLPLDDLFGRELIEHRRCDADDCGWDLSHVGNIEPDGESLLVTLGGSGVGLGACHSGTAVAEVPRTMDGQIRFQVLDVEDGSSSLFRAPDGAWLHDAGGTVRVLRRR